MLGYEEHFEISNQRHVPKVEKCMTTFDVVLLFLFFSGECLKCSSWSVLHVYFFLKLIYYQKILNLFFKFSDFWMRFPCGLRKRTVNKFGTNLFSRHKSLESGNELRVFRCSSISQIVSSFLCSWDQRRKWILYFWSICTTEKC